MTKKESGGKVHPNPPAVFALFWPKAVVEPNPPVAEPNAPVPKPVVAGFAAPKRPPPVVAGVPNALVAVLAPNPPVDPNAEVALFC
jgi:hypothetical protein